jgi:tRNA (mo5U34)-methyltransferase
MFKIDKDWPGRQVLVREIEPCITKKTCIGRCARTIQYANCLIYLVVTVDFRTSQPEFPPDWRQMVARSEEFRRHLRQVKSAVPPPEPGWYPYESLSALEEFTELIRDDFDDIRHVLAREPALDLGCGDGDFAMLFDHLGVTTDAIDHAGTNFNQLRGARLLRETLHAGVRVTDADLDSYFTLPSAEYGLAIFLGTLYHLKNPFYVLEELARKAAYCVLSTRIARVTRRGGTGIDAEPVAYLLDSRETNNDSTNYWIFSSAGLARLLARSGWLIRAELYRGCERDSNPIDADADERMFVMLKSRYRNTELDARPAYGWRQPEGDSREWSAVLQDRRQHPGLHARPLYGWHQTEEDSWRWTTKDFGIEVVLPSDRPVREFVLRCVVPEIVIESGPVTINCQIAGENAGSIRCDQAGVVEFCGQFPERALTQPALRLAFRVMSGFRPAADRRDLGVLVPLLNRGSDSTGRLPFRVL